jgi:hypothetical protein
MVKKILPLNIENFITPLTLAILFSNNSGKSGSGLRIYCNSFILTEVEYLAGPIGPIRAVGK